MDLIWTSVLYNGRITLRSYLFATQQKKKKMIIPLKSFGYAGGRRFVNWDQDTSWQLSSDSNYLEF